MGALRAAATRTYRVTAATNGGPGTGVAGLAFWNDYSPLLLNLLNQQAELQGVLIELFTPDPIPHDGFTLGPGVFGLGGNASLPPQTSGKIRFWGARPVTRNFGAFFMPWPATTDSTPLGNPNLTYLTNLQLLANQFVLPTNASDVGPSPPFPTRTVTFVADLPKFFGSNKNLVVTSLAEEWWATQRRRATPPLFAISPFW